MSQSTYNIVTKLASELNVSRDDFCTYTGLSLNTSDLVSEENRIAAIQSMFNMLRPWFDSAEGAWQWYTKQPITSFGDLTAAEIIIQNPESGAAVVIDFIESKEQGGFE